MKKIKPTHNNYQIVLVGVTLGFCLLGTPSARSQTPPADPPKTNWQSSAALGLALTRGNSDTLLFNANIETLRKWADDELRLGGNATYGSSSADEKQANGTTKSVSSTTVNQEHGFGQYNHLFSERFYGGLRLDILHDQIADVDYRFTVSPIAGYYLIKEENTKLSGELGPAFIFEQQAGETHNYTALRVGERFDHKFSARARMWQTAEYLPQVDAFATYLFNFEIGAEASLTEKISLRLVFQDNYNSEPAAGSKNNDMKLVSGISYKF